VIAVRFQHVAKHQSEFKNSSLSINGFFTFVARNRVCVRNRNRDPVDSTPSGQAQHTRRNDTACARGGVAGGCLDTSTQILIILQSKHVQQPTYMIFRVYSHIDIFSNVNRLVFLYILKFQSCLLAEENWYNDKKTIRMKKCCH
jgi:hypothetical protein